MTDDTDNAADDVTQPYRIGDPVMDAAQGRPMIVLSAPEQTVDEWSDANGYDLQGNYANGKFDPADGEAVVECVYVSDVRSEPSKTYTFPVSRVRLIDAHHADDGGRIAERVRVELMSDLIAAANDTDMERLTPIAICALAEKVGVANETIDVSRELADVATLEAPDA